MMQIWNGTDRINFPATSMSADEVKAHFGNAGYVDMVQEISGGITLSFNALGMLLEHYGLDETLTGQAALDALTAAKEAEAAAQAAAAEEAATTPDATERIAAALEYQTLATLPDQA